jgi:hypothetical protein
VKTIIIWDQCGQDALTFFVVDGDLSHLNEVYINGNEDEALVDELNNLVYDNKGQCVLKVYKRFPRKTSMNPANKIIVAGFLP